MEYKEDINILLSRISDNSDERAFKRFFDIYAGRLYQFAFSFIKTKPVAEEVVSDVFFKVWLNKEGLKHIGNIKGYLFKATYNTSLNYLNEEKRRKAISMEDIKVDLSVDLICPETELINKELKTQIENAIESLPPRCKLIYKMAKVEQMKYKEIAALLDISVKTIDHQLTIAIKKIGEVIKSYLEDHDVRQPFIVLFRLFLPSK